jgi:hypothetical protein
MMYVLGAALSLLSAFASVGGALWVYIHLAKLSSRTENVEQKLSSLQSKLASQDRWSRDEIRDSVDNYLQNLDLETGSGMDGDLMQMMLPALMQGMGSGPAQGNAEQPGPVEQPTQPLNVLGSGGENGSSE